MRRVRRLAAMFVLAALASCTTAPSTRLEPATEPIVAVRLFAFDAPNGAAAAPELPRLAETLKRNGMKVGEAVVLQRPLADLAALERRWSEPTPSSGATHALVFTRQRVDSIDRAEYVRYEAVLWNATSRRLVWKSSLVSVGLGAGLSAAQRTDRLAGDALRGLARDGFLVLPAAAPRDASGIEIPATVFSTRLL
jgi:hypothetical protein